MSPAVWVRAAAKRVATSFQLTMFQKA
ncbi:hypothetical protein DEU38_12689, partial [Rhodococcus sp. AG1013]